MREPAERLRDILEAIVRIKKYSARGREAFETEELIQSWFIRHIQIIGEAARAMPETLQNRTKNIPWRHILVHNYFGIDHAAVWKVVSDDLPVLETQIEILLKTLEDGQ